MKWRNKYHKGFNRLWFVITCIPVVIALIYSQLGSDFKTDRYVDGYVSYKLFARYDEDTIAEWIQQKWRKKHNPDNPVSAVLFAARWLTELKSLPEAKHYTDDELESIINRAIKSEKTYSGRLSAKRQQALIYFSITLAVCIAIFGFGHGVFLVVWWIIRGFR